MAVESTNKKGEKGVFCLTAEWNEITALIRTLREENEALELEIEKARGEQKYKLKKLSQIIERKDKQLEALRSKLEG